MVPASLRASLSSDLARSESRDLRFIAAARAAGLAPSTINNKLSLLREFFSFLVDEGVMTRQPILRHRHHVAAPTTLPKPMPEADLVRFFKVVDSIRDRLLFLLMLRCGLRVSEACALAWDDLDLPALTLRVDGGRVTLTAWLTWRRCRAGAPVVADASLRSPYLFPAGWW
jgi:integrase